MLKEDDVNSSSSLILSYDKAFSPKATWEVKGLLGIYLQVIASMSKVRAATRGGNLKQKPQRNTVGCLTL